MNTARKIATFLLRTKAVKLSPKAPFKWSSGWNYLIGCRSERLYQESPCKSHKKGIS
jgi:hypothetical protein